MYNDVHVVPNDPVLVYTLCQIYKIHKKVTYSKLALNDTGHILFSINALQYRYSRSIMT